MGATEVGAVDCTDDMDMVGVMDRKRGVEGYVEFCVDGDKVDRDGVDCDELLRCWGVFVYGDDGSRLLISWCSICW
jgi:hypothetical protein